MVETQKGSRESKILSDARGGNFSLVRPDAIGHAHGAGGRGGRHNDPGLARKGQADHASIKVKGEVLHLPNVSPVSRY